MAKYDTKIRRATAKRQAGRRFFSQLGLLFVSFSGGYLCASFYDYTRLSAWVSTHVLATQPVPAADNPLIQSAHLQKPKFEFYTLLTQEQRTGTPIEGASVVGTPIVAPALPLPSQPMDLTVTPSVGHARAILPVPLLQETLVRAAPVLANKEAYLLQLASFRRQQDAERMKASLIMKGFDANIAAVIQQNINWYRVIIGPYASRTDAQRAQGSLARSERIMGMIRKMDA